MNPSGSIGFEPVIWARLLEAQVTARGGKVSAEAARFLLSMGFSKSGRNRIAYLAGRSQEGELTSEEAAGFDSYVHVGDILTIMKSKARTVLGVPAAAPQTA